MDVILLFDQYLFEDILFPVEWSFQKNVFSIVL